MIKREDPSVVDTMLDYYKGNEEQLKSSEALFQQQDMTKLIKFYTTENIPDKSEDDHLFKTFWAILGKSPILTFLDSEDEEVFDSFFRIAKLKYLISIPSYKYTFKTQDQMNQLRIYFKSAIKRAIGFQKDKINERTLEQTQINQINRTNTEGMNMPQKTGFFGRVGRML